MLSVFLKSMKKRNASTASSVAKTKRAVNSEKLSHGLVMGTQGLNEFYADKQKEATSQKTTYQKKDGSWKIHPSQSQWRESMKTLNPVQRCLLVDLNFYARTKKECYPSEETLARNLNISKKTVARNIKILTRKRLISKTKEKGKSNTYKLKISF